MRQVLTGWPLLAVWGSGLAAQDQPARSSEYLFTTGPVDIRALWINPGALSVIPQASLVADVSFARGADEDWRTSQYSFGVSSRGIGLGYQRDRFETGGIGTWRLGGSINLGPGGFGTAISFHDSNRSYDVGVRYSPAPPVHLAGVVRNIGRPTVRDSVLRVTAVAGLGWQPARTLRLSGEAVAVERRPDPGYTISYRAGIQFGLSSRGQVRILGAVRLDENLAVQRWSAGLLLGGFSQIAGVTTGVHSGSFDVEELNLSAVSARVTR